MTDRMDNSAREEQAIEQALSRAMAFIPRVALAATGQEPRLLPGGEGADAALVREYTELLGLLPYDLATEAPPTGLRKRILERISGAGVSASRVSEGRATGDPESMPLAELPVAATSARPAWGNFALAAVFAACLLAVGFLGGLVWKQSQQIDRLAVQLAVAEEGSEFVTIRQQLETVQSRLDMITTVARRAYPLRTVSHTDAAARAEGIVYVCGRHQQWYLNIQGLEPPAGSQVYRLWFMTREGKKDGGVIDVRPDRSSEREDFSMPEGTIGFEVTLENSGSPDELESLTILLGESPINL